MYIERLKKDLRMAGFARQTVDRLTERETHILGMLLTRDEIVVHFSYSGEVLALASKGLIEQEYDSNTQKHRCWMN